MIYIIIVFLLIVLGLELYFFSMGRKKIKLIEDYILSDIAKSSLSFNKGLAGVYQISLSTEDSSSNKQFRLILERLNTYFTNSSQGTVNQDVLKSLIFREYETISKNISEYLTLPLYTGLGGTFLGVGIGLLIFLFGSSADYEKGVGDFILGIILAMSGSFLGLLFTTINNSLTFRRTSYDANMSLNWLFEEAQLKVLTKYNGVIEASLGKFKENLDGFSLNFENNIKLFKSVIDEFKVASESQENFIQGLKSLNLISIIQANKDLFETFSSKIDKFRIFNTFLDNLSLAVERSNNGTENLYKILEKISGFESSMANFVQDVKGINETHSALMSNLRIGLDEIEERRKLTNNFFADNDAKLQDTVKQYSDYLNSSLEKMKSHFVDQHERFEGTLGGINDQFIKFQEQLDVHYARIGFMEGGEQLLSKLNYLSEIKTKMDELHITNYPTTNQVESLNRALNDIRGAISGIQSNGLKIKDQGYNRGEMSANYKHENKQSPRVKSEHNELPIKKNGFKALLRQWKEKLMPSDNHEIN